MMSGQTNGSMPSTGSIRNRVTVYIVSGTALLLVLAGIAVDHTIRIQVARDFDRNLLYKAEVLAKLTEREGRVVKFDFNYDFMPEFDVTENEKMEYFELSFSDGTPIAKSRSLGGATLPQAGPLADWPRYTNVTLPDGRTGRMVAYPFSPPVNTDEEDFEEAWASDSRDPGETLVRFPDQVPTDVKIGIMVARGKAPLFHLLKVVRITLVSACLGLVLTVWLFVRYCVDRGLAPLRRIAEEVRSLDSTKLNTRLDTDPKSEELKPITDQLNHLLERLDEAFEREKRFSGNVAHELRTPIAELRTLAEVGKRWPGDLSMVKAFFGDLVDLADDMERTVTNLLNLARLDAGQHHVDLKSVNLSGLIERCWKQSSVEAEIKEVSLDNRVDRELQVVTDEDKLLLIVINLFSNAVNYSAAGSIIVVEARETDSAIQFSVSNLTVDLTERDLPLMFERFWRKDKARTKGRYAGLGLSLVQALGDILGLEVRPQLDPDGRLTMTLEGFQAT